MDTLIENSIRTAIVHSLRGPARELVGLFNNSREKVVLQRETVVGRVKAANILPPLLVPRDDSTYYDIPENVLKNVRSDIVPQYILKSIQVSTTPPEPSRERLDKLFSKLDLSGTEEWDEFDQQCVGELIKKFHHIFALDDKELGCTEVV